MSKLTREQAEDTIEGLDGLIGRGVRSVYLDMAITGMRQLMAAMDSEQVAIKLPPKMTNDRKTARELNTGVDVWNRCIDEVAKLNGKSILSEPPELHPDTQKLVTDFCTALAEKLYKAQLKYGHSDNWSYANWEIECQTAFHEHIAKGDPRDVAAYCAFMWYHGWKTESAQPAPVVPDGLLSMAASAIEDLLEHTDPNTSYYSGVWADVPGKLRAAMLQAGNSPVIPGGLIGAVNRLLDSDGSRGCYSAIRCGDAHDEIEHLLAAVPQEVKS
ncbi:MAG: hypothetical protein E7D33_00585 [Klebsiella sp.]|uniref:hypothetical protein n=1 Tax=Klebsiella sp. TaxID=576 RepID=UPI0028FE6FDD|nr:hypothetical protein [Klebsiella sp.]MDU2398664.1 hypothetical protein [Klebsiella sp.]MDU2430897.1 hypothetical protein [Klebsiella sp.]MDU2477241.1 hypothetical protein [Klebsiella sp.]MDU2510410.1 hypothetical protein [Klebsiella sp.]MDU2539660.1 hypothetical protein [Klebsiella sp.]